MNEMLTPKIGYSVCPHDCPSTCALDVEFDVDGRISRLKGSKDNTYTDGVICAKVARYSERLYHPNRLLKPLIRKGEKGGGNWQEVSINSALDLIAERFVKAEQKYGSETVWPYFFAGTMGLVQRDSIQRLRFAKRYSNQFDTICVTPAWTGFFAGAGSLRGSDPREMAKSDCVVIWGTNPVATQVNVMTHAIKARKTRNAKIVVIDIYETPTIKQADLGLVIRPGTDGAFACAVMHILFRDGLADQQYLEKYTDDPKGLEIHLRDKTPEWAANITGLSVSEIEEFGQMVGSIKKTYFRLGYGFSRSRNGALNMHAALCVPAVSGAWRHEGGGGFHSNHSIYNLDASLTKGTGFYDPSVRTLDMSQIGRVLTNDRQALGGGVPVTAMLIQNTNPVNVAPEQRLVQQGFLREDLFTVVHEQFMTDTAKLADVVLPATMFLEHDDLYRGGGHQHIMYGPKQVEAPEGPVTNLFVIDELATRLGVGDLAGFGLSENEHIDALLKSSDRGTLADIEKSKWIDCQVEFDDAHYLNGFDWPDKKFRFKTDFKNLNCSTKPPENLSLINDTDAYSGFPNHVDIIEESDKEHPFRLATSPARSFLNSTFTETKTAQKREKRPTLLLNIEDARVLGIIDEDIVHMGNERGSLRIHVSVGQETKQGVVIAEGIWPNSAHLGGEGINILTGADPVYPFGGAAFHDNHVWIKKYLD